MTHQITGFRKKAEYVIIVTFNLVRKPIVSSMITAISVLEEFRKCASRYQKILRKY